MGSGMMMAYPTQVEAAAQGVLARNDWF